MKAFSETAHYRCSRNDYRINFVSSPRSVSVMESIGIHLRICICDKRFSDDILTDLSR